MSLSQNMNSENVDEPVSYVKIFGTFIRIGLFTLGGGLAMAAVLRHELVLNRKWVKDDDFMAEMSTATVIPGAIAVNLAYLQGLRLRGKGGAAIAVFGTILPSFSIMLLIALFAFPYFKQPKVAAFFKGCAIAVAGLLAFAGYTFGKKLLRTWSSAFVCLAGVMVVALLGVHPIWTVITTGVLGYYLYKNDST